MKRPCHIHFVNDVTPDGFFGQFGNDLFYQVEYSGGQNERNVIKNNNYFFLSYVSHKATVRYSDNTHTGQSALSHFFSLSDI